MISRRFFLASTGAALVFTHPAAAQPTRVWRIGYLAPGLPDDAYLFKAFLEGLQALGYIEGQNIVIEQRTAKDRYEALPALAQELMHLKVDVIVAPTTPVARAAQSVSPANQKSMPRVMHGGLCVNPSASTRASC